MTELTLFCVHVTESLEIISHFSLPIVAVPDVTLTTPDVLYTLFIMAVKLDTGCVIACP